MTASKQAILCLVLGLVTSLARAHEGHVHGPEGADAPAFGPITLSKETIQNLGLQTVEANPAPLQRSLQMAARIEGLPERQARISPRAEGRVAEILVKLGDRVTAGQALLRFDPLTVGNPPVVLKSPIDGFVVRQDASIGQALRPETVLMEVADYTHVLARATTFESPDLSAIKAGDRARVRVQVFPDQVFEGKVQRLDVALERESGTFEVYVLLDNSDLKLRPNMQATATIGIGEGPEVVALPQRAVLGDLGNLFVFVQTDEPNTFERRNVVIGMKAGDLVEIVEGVLPGEKVVIQGNYQLQFAVTAKKTEEAAAKPDEMGHTDHDHAEESKGSWFHFPGWVWAIGGFGLGSLLFGFLLRRTA
ncbi:MAG TPA: efflux RND transporter periplasmic adaptor subunit [Chthoniobacterales bacterium]|jgi:multidrug efflux pump subunit AcrA (membrane-fusion protein)|nr:efflux RND transporter periplasmic adaptor subunit [Chthoniobacterales bacterium]